MYWLKDISLWLTHALAVLAGGSAGADVHHLPRLRARFVFQIAAGPMTSSGFIAGVLTFTPYYHWRWEHAIHHGTSGQLDKRGIGDIWTMTVQEYLDASRWRRFSYRLARNPIVLFVIAPLFVFVILQRFPRPQVPAGASGTPWGG